MKKHILLVDDEAPIREILAQMLDESGYRVSQAESAVEAQNLARTDAPDLIISDLQLEESDGLTMITQLKAQRPDLPVILLTGVLFDADVVQNTLMKVVTAYLPKTTPLAKILSEVKRCAGG
ncbi:MAG: response regulator [Verrucomicrobia bacterium]|nr:response regulator [Verrucomicrobiota bacterium]